MDLTVEPGHPYRGRSRRRRTRRRGDSWYDTGFNTLQPTSTGPQALGNFGPLRAGFLELADAVTWSTSSVSG